MAAAVPIIGQGVVAAARMPVYDVVSIHPANPDSHMMRIMSLADGFSGTGVSLKSLISSAYTVKSWDQISALSGPLSSARFDIEAKMDQDTASALKKLPKEEEIAQRRLMMQTMLADRFKLKVHHESKQVPIYLLVIAKSGFKLKEADPNNIYANGIKGPDGLSHSDIMMMSNGRLTAQAISISSLAGNVGGQVQRIVEDRTGLTRKYDITLQWSPDDNPGTSAPGGQDVATATNSGPSIFTALQEQLGLKLESAKEPVDVIVVDHVEMPSEN